MLAVSERVTIVLVVEIITSLRAATAASAKPLNCSVSMAGGPDVVRANQWREVETFMRILSAWVRWAAQNVVHENPLQGSL